MEKVDPNRLWYAYANGKEVGPLKEVELRHRIITGNFTADSHAFTDGMSDWKALGDIHLFDELFNEDSLPTKNESLNEAFEKIPFSKNAKRPSDSRFRNLLILSLLLFGGAVLYYIKEDTADKSLALVQKSEAPISSDDPFATKDWSELKHYRQRHDIEGSGFVVARDNIDEEFPVVKAAVSTQFDSGELNYRIYPVPGANLMPLPQIFSGTSTVRNGFFVIGPLSDGGNPLPVGKYRLIAQMNDVFLGEVTLLRGHLPEGEELQKAEEKMKLEKLKRIAELKTKFANKAKSLQDLVSALEGLKHFTNLAQQNVEVQKALDKLRQTHTAVETSSGNLSLLGAAESSLQKVNANLWTEFYPALAELPNVNVNRFGRFDAQPIRNYLNQIKTQALGLTPTQITQASEQMLQEASIKRSLVDQNQAAAR